MSEDADIVAVASSYLERFSDRTGIRTRWVPSADVSLPYRIEQELWRIGQEALVNIERHAEASEVAVHWNVRNGVARLEVVDDGVGFEVGSVSGDHYGLVGIRERADAIGGQLTIERRPEGGIRVVVEVALSTPTLSSQNGSGSAAGASGSGASQSTSGERRSA